MNQTIPISDIAEFMTRRVVDVFDTMLSLKAIPVPKANVQLFSERVTGSGGFAGRKVVGTVYLHLSLPLANQMTAAMAGLAPHEIPDDSAVNDAVGEISNMLNGGLKSWICDHGIKCVSTTPTIFRGAGFTIEPLKEIQRLRLVFDCGDDRFAVEIHIKFN